MPTVHDLLRKLAGGGVGRGKAVEAVPPSEGEGDGDLSPPPAQPPRAANLETPQTEEAVARPDPLARAWALIERRKARRSREHERTALEGQGDEDEIWRRAMKRLGRG